MTEENAQLQKLRINLHASQHAFLQYLSSAVDVDASEIFRQLVELAGLPVTEHRNTHLGEVASQYSPKLSAADSGAKKWKRISIYLDAEHIRLLQSLAERKNASESNFLRHLLADFMERSKASSGDGHFQLVRSFQRFLAGHKAKLSLVVIVLLAGALATLMVSLREGSSIKVGPHWAGNAASLILDPHTHTRYSDGRLSPADLVDLAVQGGCDALVVSDHSDMETMDINEQMLELQELRDDYPDLLLFAGIELNMPSHGGREHAGVIADPSVPAETLQQLLDEARRGRKRVKNGGASHAADMQLLQIVADYQALQKGLLLVHNHPSWKDQDISENFSGLTKWNADYPLFTVIEGAPGHQNAPVLGSYEEPYLTQDHWDPVVAEVGGVWDQLLSEGHQLWGAMASSDYHNEELDKAPCEFSRTHLVVPEQSYRGVLKALEMGTFWADHGRILNQLWFSVEVDGLEQAAYPGYTVYVGDRDSMGLMNLAVERGPGSVGQPLTVEFIGSCLSGDAEIVAVEEMAPDVSTASVLLPLAATGRDELSCTLRARVRLSRESSTDYLAYTNPIRLILD